MTRTRWVLIGILVILGVAAGAMYIPWGGGESGPIRAKNPDRPMRTVTDMAGREVSIPEHPQRILSLNPSATDTVVRLGEGGLLTAIGMESTAIPGSGAARVVGRGPRLNRRQVAAVNPDMAFAAAGDKETVETLSRLNVPVVSLTRPVPEEIPDLIRFIGKCIGRPGRAKKVASSLEDYLQKAEGKKKAGGSGEAPTVYLELNGPFRTAGRGTYPHGLLRLAGARNVAAGMEGFGKIPSQTLLDADPDILLYVARGERAPNFEDRPGLETLTAVKNKRIAPVKRHWLIPGAGLPAAVEGLRKVIRNPTPPSEKKNIENLLDPEDL